MTSIKNVIKINENKMKYICQSNRTDFFNRNESTVAFSFIFPKFVKYFSMAKRGTAS